MASLYPWFVFTHVVGVVIFAVAHGASVVVALRLRSERDPHTVATLLGMSQSATGPMYIGLALLIVGGLGAAAAADLWLEPWIIASAVVLIVVLGVMYSVATPYYQRLRATVGPDAPSMVGGEELAALLDSRRPYVLLVAGGIGLVALVWLMVVKPG